MSSPAASIITGSGDFIQKAADAWKLIKGVKKISEPCSKVSDAFGLADQAMSGTLPAYNPQVEKVREFIARQKDTLAELARRDENDWMDRSGANLFRQAAILQARSCLDHWIINFMQLKTVIAQFLPMAQGARDALSNRAVVGLRSALAESSLPALDGIAMGQIVGDLNNSEWSLDLIIRRLRNCLSALR